MTPGRRRIGLAGARAARSAGAIRTFERFGRRSWRPRATATPRVARPEWLRLTLVRRPIARPPRILVQQRVTNVGLRLHLVLAPRAGGPIAAGPSGPGLRPGVAAPGGRPVAVVQRRLERLIERVTRAATRVERIPDDMVGPPAGSRAGSGSGALPAIARSHPGAPALVFVRPPGLLEPSAANDVPAAPRIAASRPDRAPWLAPVQPDLAGLTDQVLASIDRRIVAERERKGRI